MQTLKCLAAAALSLGFVLAAPADAATQNSVVSSGPELMTEAVPITVSEMARGYGSSRVTKDAVGDPMVSGKSDGLGYSIFFYGCDKGKSCDALQFHSSFDLGKRADLAVLNAWNLKKRYAKAELNDKGFAVVHLDYPFAGGVTRQHLDNVMDLWVMLLKEFAVHIGFRK